jgi:hypothetical protein
MFKSLGFVALQEGMGSIGMESGSGFTINTA